MQNKPVKEHFVSALPLPKPRQSGLEEALARLGQAIADKKSRRYVSRQERIDAATKVTADAYKVVSDRIVGERNNG